MFRRIKKLIVFLCGLACIFVLYSAFVNFYMVFGTRDSVHTIDQIQEEGIHADAIVVLGASVLPDGTPSDILADRLETASDLYLSGASDALIVSGDNRNSNYNETAAMKSYCVSMGVSENAIYADYAGYDTYDSIYRARNVFGANSVIIVTQAYHLYRALSIAKGLGMEASGVASDKGDYQNQDYYSLREILARDVDFIYTLFALPAEDTTQAIS